MVVDVQPMRKDPGPVALPPVGPGVGPLLEHGSMEPLDLAVGLGPVGPAVAVLDGSERLVEQLSPVAEPVVGEDPHDDDPLRSEPGLGPAPEGGRGGTTLV